MKTHLLILEINLRYSERFQSILLMTSMIGDNNMRIAFDLTPIYDHLTGVERYNINISKEIIKAHPENDYILLFKDEVHKTFLDVVKMPNVEFRIIPECNKLFFIQWRLYREVQKIDADYYIFLSFTSPILFSKQKIINAIHDLTCWDCPESIPAKMKFYYHYTYKVAAHKSWKIVTVSKFSQSRICEKYELSKDKVLVIYDGLTDIFCEEPRNNHEIKMKYGLPDKYILSLSTIEPRKNIQLLIRAYKELVEEKAEVPGLVLSGRKGWKLEEIVGDIDENVRKRIQFTGFINDEDLPQIYREAELFIFPSKYEGFGLPVIEAMSQGTVVVSSDAASLPEVAGDAGILFHSGDKESLKKAILNAFDLGKQEKCNRIEKGIRIAHSFSWKREAEKLYQSLTEESMYC